MAVYTGDSVEALTLVAKVQIRRSFHDGRRDILYCGVVPTNAWGCGPDHDTFPGSERARCPRQLLQQPSWEGPLWKSNYWHWTGAMVLRQ